MHGKHIRVSVAFFFNRNFNAAASTVPDRKA